MPSLRRVVGSVQQVWRTEGARGLFSLAAKNPPALWCRPSFWASRKNDHQFMGRLIELTGNRVRVGGCRFRVDSPAIPTFRKSLFWFDRYEIEERRALGRFLQPELPVVEFGGSIGVVACITNARLRDPEQHVVVEANPDVVPLLEQNRDRNGARFTVLHRAVAYGAKEVVFRCGDFLDSGIGNANGRPVTVPAITFADVVERFGFQRCTLICDIEGGEIELVANELPLLRERVETMVFEAHPSMAGVEPTRAMFAALEQACFAPVFREQETWVLLNTRLRPLDGHARVPSYRGDAATAR